MALSEASAEGILGNLKMALDAAQDVRRLLRIVAEDIALDNQDGDTVNDMIGTVNLLNSTLAREYVKWNTYLLARQEGWQ